VPRGSTAYAAAAIAIFLFGLAAATRYGHAADMVDMTGVQPWDLCGECHGLDGAGNRIKFPRLAGQKQSYIISQLLDFRAGRRKNDDGQMQETADELAKADIPRVADWFANQTAPWPKLTIDAKPDLARARQLALSGRSGIPACLSCHSAASLGMLDEPFDAPRIAGQRDYYIAKELTDYRDGRRNNDPKRMMQKIAQRLTDSEIVSLAILFSQNPSMDDLVVP
jgi:cytochrome c553